MSEEQEQSYDYDVFISHGDADGEWVRRELLPRLEGAGLKVCVVWRDFEPGAPRVDEAERLVTTSRKTLLVLTPGYLENEWAEFGNQMVQTIDPGARARRMIPLLKEKCELPLRISHLYYLNFADPEERDIAWTQLLTALGAPPVQEAPEAPTRAGWYLDRPFLMPANFTGRVAEREMLDQWLEGDPNHPLLVIRALGGFGKSALTWHWLLHDVDPGRWSRVVWWSFYETEASFEAFIAETLAYLGVDPTRLGPRQQVDALLQSLRQPGTLLILDGFERELRAYSGMGAAYQGDEEPPPPRAGEGRGGGQADQPPASRLTDCVSPIAEHFLRSVASLPRIVRGKVLMTTRLCPRILESRGGDLLVGCQEQELTQIQPADAVAFFRAQGIRGGRAEIEAACAPYGYHPLSLRLLAGLIVDDPQQPGDVAAAQRLDVSGDLKQRQHHVLAQAYTNLTETRQRLLSRVACFRGPVSYETLAALEMPVPEPEPKRRGFLDRLLGRSEKAAPVERRIDLESDLRSLVARGLLHHDRETHRYDLHPIVRRYAYDRLGGAERAAAHGHLRDYFAAVPTPERVQQLEDLAPVIELYHHTVRSGQYDNAYSLFRDRIDTPTYFQFGAYQLQIELLRALFPDGEDKLPRLKDEHAQSSALNDLSAVYNLSGQPRRAAPLIEASNAIDEKRGDKRGVAIGLGNLAYQQIAIGALRAAEANLRRRVALCREIEDERNEAVGHQELGRLLAYRGAWEEAREELDAALALFEEQQEVQSQCVVWAYRALRALLLARAGALPASTDELKARTPSGSDAEAALAAARRALELAEEFSRSNFPLERDYVRAHWLLGAAHRAVASSTSSEGALEAAERHLSEALIRCRRINMVDHEAYILLDMARLRAAQHAREEARRLVEEALTITERSEYALQGADVHLFLAELALEADDRATALEHARQARRLATCDGPPDYTYKVAYEEAGALLERLTEDEGRTTEV